MWSMETEADRLVAVLTIEGLRTLAYKRGLKLGGSKRQLAERLAEDGLTIENLARELS